MKRIGFIGCGNMGEAFLKGLLTTNLIRKENVFVYDKSKRDSLKEKYEINIIENEIEVMKKSDIVFLATKPNTYFEIIDKIKDELNNQLIITMAPGININQVMSRFGKKTKIVRTMPNLPLMVQEGCIAYTFSDVVTLEERNYIEILFKKIALSIEITEVMYDAVIGASGSSPAFIFMFIEAIADGVVCAGLDREIAYKLIGKTLIGCGKMFLESKKHPGELKDSVCSPGGTTIEGVSSLEKNGFRGNVIEAVIKTIEKSRKMTK